MGSISVTSACVYTIVASCAAFIAGRGTSIYIIGTIQPEDVTLLPKKKQTHQVPFHEQRSYLPAPQLIEGKEAPKSRYTSMVFSDVSSASENYASLHLEVHGESPFGGIHNDGQCVETDDGHKKCLLDTFDKEDYEAAAAHELMTQGGADDDDDDDDEYDEEEDAMDEEEHLPAGQHLLIDIERVDSDFLNSEVRLAEAMVSVVNESKLTLLSYHCHKLIPMGVSCVGVLLESHISLHTWPEAGVITLDLFTCGSGKLVPVLPIVRNLFAIPRVGASDKKSEQPQTIWSHKLRGFRKEEDYLSKDLGAMVLDTLYYSMKEEVVSVQTPFQRIDIFDVLTHEDYENYEKSLANDNSYQSRNPLMFEPERLVFLDGVLQSLRDGNEAYHEALVHPAMFLHPNPKRVAIIGGGEGATLEEVLKHDTLQKVKMIEIDEMMVEISRKYLPDWNNCTDYVGSAPFCGDDERADIHYVDAFAWFNDRFSEDSDRSDEEPFDVLIMDALDPEDDIPFAKMLYNDLSFVKTLYNSLSDNGVIVLQLGEAADYGDPAAVHTTSSRREILIELLEEVGFEAMHVYEDGNCGFSMPWTFLVAMKDEEIDLRWYMNEAQIEVEIHSRIVHTKSGKPALEYFDGNIMQGYQYPHKVFESVFCLGYEDACVKDKLASDVPISALEVGMSGVGDGSGRGVYTTVDIQQGSSIGRSSSKLAVHIPGSALALIFGYYDKSQDIQDVYNYIDGYGWETYSFGGKEYFVEPSIMTFVNHGCNGTFNILDGFLRESAFVTEQNATLDDFRYVKDEVYNIFYDRHVMHSALSGQYASRDIKAGEEILSSYVHYTSDPELWYKEVQFLKLLCSGEEVGFITKAEGVFNSTR